MTRFEPSRYEVAAKASTDPDELATLAQRSSSFVRSAVARNAHTSTETLASLAVDGDAWVQAAVARNRHTPDAILVVLGQAPDKKVAEALADRWNASPDMLRTLAASPYDEVRVSVAKNKATPADTLGVLAGDRNAYVVAGVAWNQATPDGVLIPLTRHRSPSVIDALAKRHSNKNTRSRTVIGRGMSNQGQQMRIPIEEGGRFSPDLIRAFTDSSVPRLHKAAASQPDAPQECLAVLAAHDDVWIRVRVAENPGAGEAVLLALATAGGSEVLGALAGRQSLPSRHTAPLPVPAVSSDDEGPWATLTSDGEPVVPDAPTVPMMLPESVLATVALSRARSAHALLPAGTGARLLSSPDPKTRAAAAKVLRAEETDAWAAMLTDSDKKVRAAGAATIPSSLLPNYVDSPCAAVRAEVADRIGDPETLRLLSQDPEALVRRRVIRNTVCPIDAFSALTHDTDTWVAKYAAERVLAALMG